MNETKLIDRLGVGDLVRYLAGDAKAMRKIASTPHVIWIGLVLVLSAGFAREYDGESLLHEPWHLLIPAVASLATSAMLFALILLPRSFSPSSTFSYRSFLSLYWMTAPLAWIYAIPVERMMDLGNATRANLTMLGVVALWRVVLMARVVAVICKFRWWVALFTVMLFADAVALTLIWFMPMPIISFMGGIHLNEHEELLVATRFLVVFFGVVSLPVWLVGYWIGIYKMSKTASKESANEETNNEETETKDRGGNPQDVIRPAAQLDSSPTLPQGSHVRPAPPISWSLKGLAIASLVVWIPILPMTQPEQQRRRAVEHALLDGQIHNGIDLMLSATSADFPPHWEPPPWLALGQRTPNLLDTLEVVDAKPTRSDWVRDLYWRKWTAKVDDYYEWTQFWAALCESETARWLTLLERLPPDSPTIARQSEKFLMLVESHSHEKQVSDDSVARIVALLERAGIEVERPIEFEPAVETATDSDSDNDVTSDSQQTSEAGLVPEQCSGAK